MGNELEIDLYCMRQGRGTPKQAHLTTYLSDRIEQCLMGGLGPDSLTRGDGAKSGGGVLDFVLQRVFFDAGIEHANPLRTLTPLRLLGRPRKKRKSAVPKKR
jgi:hypothetical protein